MTSALFFMVLCGVFGGAFFCSLKHFFFTSPPLVNPPFPPHTHTHLSFVVLYVYTSLYIYRTRKSAHASAWLLTPSPSLSPEYTSTHSLTCGSRAHTHRSMYPRRRKVSGGENVVSSPHAFLVHRRHGPRCTHRHPPVPPFTSVLLVFPRSHCDRSMSFLMLCVCACVEPRC